MALIGADICVICKKEFETGDRYTFIDEDMIHQSCAPITLEFLNDHKKSHFQCVINNDFISMNNVFTGLGLYRAIFKIIRLYLNGKYNDEFKNDVKNQKFLSNKKLELIKKICKYFIMGTNENAQRHDGKIIVRRE